LGGEANDGRSKSDVPVLDHLGRPLPRRRGIREQLQNFSGWTKAIILAVVAIVTGFAVFLSSLGTIQNYFQPPRPLVEVPQVTVKLTNSTNDQIGILKRGDFLLWLPGGSGHHIVGKYELLFPQEKDPGAPEFIIPPSATIIAFAKLLNEKRFVDLLEQSEFDLSIIVRKTSGGLAFTEALPFTRAAIEKYFTSVNFESSDGNKPATNQTITK
jgi:hypothetical protein